MASGLGEWRREAHATIRFHIGTPHDPPPDLRFILIIPIPTIAATLLYYDLRVRTESADLDAMIAELPSPAAGA